jgi:hypothetical protein
MLRVLEDCIGGAQLDNFALIHHRNAIAEKTERPRDHGQQKDSSG